MDRRKFLKNSIQSFQAASLLGLTGCAALDRYFEIEKSDYSKEVLVFGAGISGLCTAYFLKRNGVPYRLFEASGRVGGRILSQRFPTPVGSIELGARYIDSMDHELTELIKDMNLELEEAPIAKNANFFCMNKEVTSYKSLLSAHTMTFKLWNRELARVHNLSDQLEKDPMDDAILDEIQSYSRVSFADILNDSKLDFKGRFIFKNWTEMQFQKKVADISYLEWLFQLEKLTLSGKKMYMPSGMSQFVDILAQRVSGVIPNYNLQLESKLMEIQRVQDRWVCKIQTLDGLKKISSPFVVVALPFNQLKFIKGIDAVFTNKQFRESLDQAQFKTHYRVVFKSAQKSMKENGTYYFFETSRFSVNKEEYVYTLDVDRSVDHSEINLMKTQMASVFGIKDFEEVNFYSWTQHPQISGSELRINTNALLPIKRAYMENWDQMTLQLAGDYLISPENANLNDCVKTAANASRHLTQLVLEKEWA